MTESLVGLLISIIKWFFEKKAKKKLNDAEFLAHIEAHQMRRAGVGRQATDFEDNVAQAYDEMSKK